MERHDFEKLWTKAKDEVRTTFGKLTDEDIPKIEGRFENLVERVQNRYAQTKDWAVDMVMRFLERYREPAAPKAGAAEPRREPADRGSAAPR